jgi:hypothetical protein
VDAPGGRCAAAGTGLNQRLGRRQLHAPRAAG